MARILGQKYRNNLPLPLPCPKASLSCIFWTAYPDLFLCEKNILWSVAAIIIFCCCCCYLQPNTLLTDTTCYSSVGSIGNIYPISQMKTLKLQKNEGAQFITVGLRFQLTFPDYKSLAFSIWPSSAILIISSYWYIYVNSTFPSIKDKSNLFWALRVPLPSVI